MLQKVNEICPLIDQPDNCWFVPKTSPYSGIDELFPFCTNIPTCFQTCGIKTMNIQITLLIHDNLWIWVFCSLVLKSLSIMTDLAILWLNRSRHLSILAWFTSRRHSEERNPGPNRRGCSSTRSLHSEVRKQNKGGDVTTNETLLRTN